MPVQEPDDAALAEFIVLPEFGRRGTIAVRLDQFGDRLGRQSTVHLLGVWGAKPLSLTGLRRFSANSTIRRNRRPW